jgi:hypothetical protein
MTGGEVAVTGRSSGPAQLHGGDHGDDTIATLDAPGSGCTGLSGASRPPPGRQASAFALIVSNSACVIAPLSRSCLAVSISAAGPPLPATFLT